MRVNISQFLYLFLYLSVLFSNYLVDLIPIFSFFDEALALFALFYVVANNGKCTYGPRLKILVCSSIVVFIGVLGNVCFCYNANSIVVLKDVFAFLKSPLMILACSIYAEKHNTNKAMKIAVLVSKFVITFAFLMYFISLYTNSSMLYDVRHGIVSYRFVYGHPTFLTYSVVVMLCCLVSKGIQPKDYIFHFMGVVVLILTMRDKAFAFVIVYLMALLIFYRKRIKLWHVLLSILLAIVVSWSKLVEYSSYKWSPREGLYSVGLQLVQNCFPIGSGFGTFASHLSGFYYSRVYSIYGFDDRPGTNPEDFVDLGDAGLPYYYGQFGILGIILFACIMYQLYLLIRKFYFSSGPKRNASLLVLLYSLIALPVESFFVNETGATVFVVLFIFLGKEKMNAHTEKSKCC